MENETVTFHCNASGNPTPNITWVKDGLTLSTGDTLRFRAEKVLSGKYWCVVDNSLGVTIKAETDLDVQCKWRERSRPKTFSINCLKIQFLPSHP